MSKKTLLEEGTVRQFMKLANLKPLASNFINEKFGEEEEDEMLPPEPDDAAMDMAADEEAPMDMEMDAEEGAEEGAEGALARLGVSDAAVREIVDVVTTALEAATGVEIDVTGGEEGMEGMEGEEAVAMAPEGEEGEEGMDFAPAVGEEGEGDEEDALAEINMIDEDAVMKETYRRVAKRLGTMNKQHKLVESVTNRIMGRLAKSK